MAKGRTKRCRYCGRRFIPDLRVGDRQKACSMACQRLRKRENNRLYRQKNPECWQGHYEQHVKPWRQRHPDYQRKWREQRKGAGREKSLGEIQAERVKKAMGFIEKSYLNLGEIQAEILYQPFEIKPERLQGHLASGSVTSREGKKRQEE